MHLVGLFQILSALPIQHNIFAALDLHIIAILDALTVPKDAVAGAVPFIASPGWATESWS